jgi:hypothetical protein
VTAPQPQQPAPAYSPPVVAYGVETSAIFELRPSRGVRKLWFSREENILALASDPADPTRILFATDQAGRLYRLHPSGAAELLNQTERQALTTFAPVAGGALLSATHPGAVLELSNAQAESGVYQTAVRDAERMARWGRLEWQGQGSIEFQTRSGNSGQPDSSWSDWSAPLANPGGGLITSPPARYIQWRATFKSGPTQSMLERVRVSYLPQNEAPVIQSITIQPEAPSEASSPTTTDSSNESPAAYSITVSASGGSSASSGASSTQEASFGGGAGRKLAISWAAEDPNNDDLTATVEFRGDGEQDWKLLKKDVTESKITLDSDALADGRYVFRVRVSDRGANPPDAAEQAEKISSPTTIDHTPPIVTVLQVQGRESVRFEARDGVSALTGAERSIDGGPWTPVWAEDGVTDSQAETFLVPLTPSQEGERLVVIRVRDRSGNAGLAKALVK